MKKAIITGITGQDGAYLAKLLLEKGYEVCGALQPERKSSRFGLEYLKIERQIMYREVDFLSYEAVVKMIKEIQPDEVYNLAAQSSVARSFVNPRITVEFNVQSVLNILEAIRNVKPDTKFYQASSSEMYGKNPILPIAEESVLNPVSPYGTSKAAAHWTVRNYRNAYKLYAASGILFNHESVLRGSGFFVKKIIRGAIDISRGNRDLLEVGNVEIKRDFGYGPYYVEAMWKMLHLKEAQDFVICSGQSVLLKDIIYYIFDRFNISYDKMIVNPQLYRPDEIKDIYGNNSKAKELLDWQYDLDFFKVLDILIDEETEIYKENA